MKLLIINFTRTKEVNHLNHCKTDKNWGVSDNELSQWTIRDCKYFSSLQVFKVAQLIIFPFRTYFFYCKLWHILSDSISDCTMLVFSQLPWRLFTEVKYLVTLNLILIIQVKYFIWTVISLELSKANWNHIKYCISFKWALISSLMFSVF